MLAAKAVERWRRDSSCGSSYGDFSASIPLFQFLRRSHECPQSAEQQTA